ncbi:MAG: fused MFS/spermidine synthase [Coriobacteriaceae bacterium]|nr:fused MFS/spermidine synthase [Coriobacteriaceae bacterium]MCI6843766.1 fused MFS/spermidine synthase [Coriobacteriaceae bacterium]MCI7438852.1 fused MFS/spermidine synthase [Coriobacteriaceae bacterium]MDD7584878.1 fused MFS/spermidine synthase [Coriobacteriaceae bacterium]
MPTWLIVAIVISWILFAIVLALPWLLKRRGVEMRRTKFGPALIFESADGDGTPVRLLNVNGTFQSVCYLPDDLRFELACAYHRSMAEVCYDLPDATRALVIGGGGYSLTKWLVAHRPRLHVDAVEIDPRVTVIARERFFLDDLIEKYGAERISLVNGDGWDYLRRAERPYDVIVNDAFSGNRPLGQLGTGEGAQLIRERLTPGGVYLANLRCPTRGRRARILEEAKRAFSAQFAHVAYVPEWPDRPEARGNNVLIATDAELALPEGATVVK